jgi:hypothetical protein
VGTLLGADGNPLVGVTATPALTNAEAELEEYAPEYQAKIDPKLAMVEQIAKALPAASTRVISTNEEIAEAFVAHVEDLKTLGVTGSVDHRASAETLLPACARLVRKKDTTGMKGAAGEVPANAPEVGTVLSNCSRMTHLVVIRATSTKKPKVVGGINEFEGGAASGDVMIFDLAKGKLVGAAPFTATSNRALSTTWKNFESDLQDDFAQQVVNAWGAAATKAAPKRKFSM